MNLTNDNNKTYICVWHFFYYYVYYRLTV